MRRGSGKKFIRLLCCVLVLALGLSLGACAPRLKPAKTVDGKTLFRLGFSGAPDSLNPYAAGNEEAAAVLSLVYDTLFSLDPETGEYRGSLCREWTVADAAARGGKLWKLTLAPDVLWHDGKTLTAGDVEFTLQSMKDFSNRYSYPDCEYIDVTGIAVEDDNHIAFIAWGPETAVLECLSHVPVVPRHIWNGIPGVEYDSSGVPRDYVRAAEALRGEKPGAGNMIGSGLYVWGGYENGVCTLRLNEKYWGETSAAQTVELCFGCLDPAQLLRRRQIDACWDMAGSAYELLGREKGYALTAGTAGELYYLALNLEDSRSLLGERTVRLAMDLALDHAGLMNRAFGGGLPALGLLPPGSPWNYDAALNAPRSFAPPAARQLLENAGFTDTDGDGRRTSADGRTLSFSLLYSDAVPAWGRAAEEIRASLGEIGIGVTARALPPAELLDALYTGDYDLLLTGTRSYNDPFYALGMFCWNAGGNDISVPGLHADVQPGWNFSGYGNEEFDRLYSEMLYAEPTLRRELTARLGNILYDDAAVIPLGFGAVYQAASSAWTEWRTSPGGLFFTPEILRQQLQSIKIGGKR